MTSALPRFKPSDLDGEELTQAEAISYHFLRYQKCHTAAVKLRRRLEAGESTQTQLDNCLLRRKVEHAALASAIDELMQAWAYKTAPIERG